MNSLSNMRLHQYLVKVVITRKNGYTNLSSIRSARNALEAILYVLNSHHREEQDTDVLPLLATAKTI